MIQIFKDDDVLEINTKDNSLIGLMLALMNRKIDDKTFNVTGATFIRQYENIDIPLNIDAVMLDKQLNAAADWHATDGEVSYAIMLSGLPEFIIEKDENFDKFKNLFTYATVFKTTRNYALMYNVDEETLLSAILQNEITFYDMRKFS